MKKYFNKYKLLIFSLIIFSSSCDSFLDEQDENGKYSEEIVWQNPKLAEGVLLKAYGLISNEYCTNNTDKSDLATSDAVANVSTDGSVAVANGEWTSRNTFLSYYDKAYQAFNQINDFLEHVDNVDFAPQSDKTVKDLYIKKLKGEAYALRAWWGYQLLRAHGGKGKDGKLLGYPIVTTVISQSEAYIPRNTYSECIEQIMSDCDKAIEALPLKWETLSDPDENRVMGTVNYNRINGITVKAIKSNLALMAASEAFKESSVTWQEAANLAAEVMKDNNGISNFDKRGEHFYNLGTNDRDYMNSCNEIFWYSSITSNVNRENSMYAPSLYGKGFLNPTQNLVDCFGDSNGYPISQSELYSDDKPFANRDPRLKLFIYCDGDNMHGTTTLNIGNGSKDAIGSEVTSTITGYYLRKLLDETTDLTPGLQTKSNHYRVYSRYTEILLNFAEAANEAAGPDTPVEGFTARDVINALRKRAGINNTDYVNSLNKDGMRMLIRNERRIELSFENSRFWDMRRWNDLNSMNETAMGITKDSNGTYSKIEVAERKFEDYMIYAPIPYSETMKYNLVQNYGWE